MPSRKADYRYLGRLAWMALFGATVFFWFYPVNIGLLRLYFLLTIPTLLVGGAVLLWHRERLRYVPVVILGLLLVVLILPGRSQDAHRLRERYVSALRSDEGTKYVWGGENGFGIDCSGLARRALINAHVREGLLSLNPSHLRDSLELWWYDCSARAMKQGYRDWTRHLFDADSVNELSAEVAAPGDLAVTADGLHVLICLGQGTWIEADPGLGRVFAAKTPVANPWFDMPVVVLRWKRFD